MNDTYYPSKAPGVRRFSDGTDGRIVWRVKPFIPDVELEKALQEHYDAGFTIREIWRNSPNRAGLETTTICFSKKERGVGASGPSVPS